MKSVSDLLVPRLRLGMPITAAPAARPPRAMAARPADLARRSLRGVRDEAEPCHEGLAKFDLLKFPAQR